MDIECCGNCRFGLGTYDTTIYSCRRYPKVIIYDVRYDTASTFPEVSKNDWCGEYKKIKLEGKSGWLKKEKGITMAREV